MDRNASAPPMSAAGRRGLFRDIEPFSFGWLNTNSQHEIYYEECGAPRGKPAVILHGGPGGAVNPTMRRFFDPAKWRMALFDQRGCGRSRPNASLEDNTTINTTMQDDRDQPLALMTSMGSLQSSDCLHMRV